MWVSGLVFAPLLSDSWMLHFDFLQIIPLVYPLYLMGEARGFPSVGVPHRFDGPLNSCGAGDRSTRPKLCHQHHSRLLVLSDPDC